MPSTDVALRLRQSKQYNTQVEEGVVQHVDSISLMLNPTTIKAYYNGG
jgi:hypothetical protein